MEKPKKPVLVIMGGAKVADKVKLLKNLINLADEIIIGGGMKNPFFREIHKVNLGKSKLFMPDDPKVLYEIVEYAKEKNCKFHLPDDFILGKELEPGTETMYWEDSFKDVPPEWRALDLGPKSAKKFDEIISKAESIFWNGPLGYIEAPEFRSGSESVVKSIINRTK